MIKKLPISAMVVGFNEAHLLKNCLASLYFCDEIIYTDLNSTDSSLVVAAEFTNQIYHKPIAPSGEYIHAEIINCTKHEWVIFIDPDEIIDPTLATELITTFYKIEGEPFVGAVYVPWHFYFKQHKLIGTIWGGNNKKYLLVNKQRFEFLPITHYGRKLKNGFVNYEIEINSNGSNILHHYWMNSYSVFVKKHHRYLKNEGRDEYERGRRTTVKNISLTPFKEFYNSFISLKGYKDFIIGFILSIFWAYYKTRSNIGIYKIQKLMSKNSSK